MLYYAEVLLKSWPKTYKTWGRFKVKKIKTRYIKNGPFTVRFTTRLGVKETTFPRNFGKQSKPIVSNVDVLPAYRRYERKNSVAARIKAGMCELCGRNGCDVEMHQVRRLKDLRGRNQWELVMLEIRRKTRLHPFYQHDRLHMRGVLDLSVLKTH